MSDQPTVLDPSEAAIVTSGGCERIELLIPKMDGDAQVPDAVVFLMACAAKFMHDPDFVQEQLDWFHAQAVRMRQ